MKKLTFGQNVRLAYFLASLVALGCLDSENDNLVILAFLINLILAGRGIATIPGKELNDKYDDGESR